MKTLIIIKREYLTRVRKKSFILLTLLIPFLFIGLGALVGVISVKSGSKKNIAIIDESNKFSGKLESSNNVAISFESRPLDSVKNNLSQYGYDAVLYIPDFDQSAPKSLQLFYDEEPGIEAQSVLEDKLNNVLVKQRMEAAGISKDQLRLIEDHSLKVKPYNLKEGKESSNEASIVIGYLCGSLLYMFMLFYGMNVMRSVMEEKTNRIAEIIVSSVKPFQLMLGKIVGVALVGLTQFMIWVALIFILALLGTPVLLSMANPEAMNMAQQSAGAGSPADIQGALEVLKNQNWMGITLWFVFYFLGGYFLYASLFAAVGSLVNEDPQESSQYTLPITIPIILGFVIMSTAIRDPNSGIAIAGSIFPLTSPIVMMARIPFGVPAWQLIASALALILGFLGTTWMAGKIYRTGILLYGKKVTMKEVGKWLMRK